MNDEKQSPIVWVVRWTTKHTPGNASAYIKEGDARRAAANIKKYADSSNVVVVPAYAAHHRS